MTEKTGSRNVPLPSFEALRNCSTKDLKRRLALCDRAIELNVLDPIYFAERGMVSYLLETRAGKAA